MVFPASLKLSRQDWRRQKVEGKTGQQDRAKTGQTLPRRQGWRVQTLGCVGLCLPWGSHPLELTLQPRAPSASEGLLFLVSSL